MLVSLQQVTLLAISLLARGVEPQACDSGWFGENCMYQCRCPGGCDTNGICSTGTCDNLFFGPACQFYDGALLFGSANSFYNDHNESTCNPNASATSIEMRLSQVIPFLWFRVHAGRDTQLNFTTTINQTLPCTNQNKHVGTDFVDVTCGNTHKGVSHLRLNGLIVPKVCSIYISLGRNVALRQRATQIPETNQFDKRKNASNGVDGKVGVDYDHASMPCSHTESSTVTPSWSITYNRPQIILHVVIKNRISPGRTATFTTRFNQFTLQGRTSNGTTSFHYMDRVMYNEVRYFWRLTFFPSSKTSEVTITAFRRPTPQVTFLNVCELETFGETVCPDGKYGLWCGETCSCTGNAVCHPVTGVCGSPCPTGTYFFGGYSCSFTCRNCKDNMCDQRTGRCFKCSRGYMGVNCDTDCIPGSYGENCEKNCSIGCTDTCNATNGMCTCKTNFFGDNCDDCIPSSYGENCEKNCSHGCRSACNRVAGNCTCKTNFVGDNCDDCIPGSYGENCEKNCSIGCTDTCNTMNGMCTCKTNFVPDTCDDCIVGYYGHQCQLNCSSLCLEGCDRQNGSCACSGNYDGLHCADCRDGFYGAECMYNCSTRCTHVCDKMTGACSCSDNYGGPHCEGCKSGFFGHECNNCSDLCTDVCDDTTGECSCKDNYHGLHCGKCKEKYYGTTCESKCPPLCANRTCYKTSGNCFSCKVGYNGPKCEDEDTGILGSYLFLFLIIAILALALLGLILVACKQRKSDRPVKEDN